MTVIDVQTHMFTREWMDMLRANGGIYSIKVRRDGQQEVFRGETPVVIPQRGHFDYALRKRDMDAAGIDMAIVSLTCPNVYWGTRKPVARRRGSPTRAWRRRSRTIPTDLPGIDMMDMGKYDLSWSVDFIADTTLAFTRMIFDGFLDLYPNLKLIASHARGELLYLVGRFDKGDEVEIPSRRKVKARPSEYLRRIYHDCITYHPEVLRFLISVVGGSRAIRHRLSAPGARHEGLDDEHRLAAR